MKSLAAEPSEPTVAFVAIRSGHRTMGPPEIVRALQRGAERLSVRFNAWGGAPVPDHALSDAINATTGMLGRLRQLRAASTRQK